MSIYVEKISFKWDVGMVGSVRLRLYNGISVCWVPFKVGGSGKNDGDMIKWCTASVL